MHRYFIVLAPQSQALWASPWARSDPTFHWVVRRNQQGSFKAQISCALSSGSHRHPVEERSQALPLPGCPMEGRARCRAQRQRGLPLDSGDTELKTSKHIHQTEPLGPFCISSPTQWSLKTKERTGSYSRSQCSPRDTSKTRQVSDAVMFYNFVPCYDFKPTPESWRNGTGNSHKPFTPIHHLFPSCPIFSNILFFLVYIHTHVYFHLNYLRVSQWQRPSTLECVFP